jgi:hypothetical protein
MNRKRIVPLGLAGLALALAAGPALAEQKPLIVGGTVEFSFGDSNLQAEPGPTFDSYKFGSAAKLGLYTRNDYISAGMSIELAQGQANISYVDDPVTYLEGSPFRVSSAYIIFRNIFDLLELRLDIEGNRIGMGDLATSSSAWNPPDPAKSLRGVSLGLIPGNLGNFVCDFVVDEQPGSSPTAMAYATPNIWGSQFRLGWEDDIISVHGSAASFDLSKAANNWIVGADAAVNTTLGDETGPALAIQSDGTALSGQRFGLGAGIDCSLTWKGVGIGGRYLWKNAAFGKDGTILVIGDISSDFGSWGGAAAAAAGRLSWNPSALIGYGGLTLSGGYGKVLEGSERGGWNGAVELNFSKELGNPATLGFYATRYGTKTEAPFLNGNLLWKVAAAYNYHGVALTAWYGVQPYDDPATAGNEQLAKPAFLVTASVMF